MEIHTRENALPPLLKDNLIKLLRNAAEAGDSIRVTQLLREPSLKDVKKAEKQCAGLTALMLAAVKGHIEVVEQLLVFRTDTNVQSEKDENTALILASEQGHARVVQMLVDARALLNLQNVKGRTALMYASENGRSMVVQRLIAAGAELNVQNMDRWTALMLASWNGRVHAVELLSAAGAKVQMRDKNGETALMLAARQGHDEVVMQLVAAGADIHLQDKNGDTALIKASLQGSFENVRFLLAEQAKVQVRNKSGKSAWDVALTPEIKEILSSNPYDYFQVVCLAKPVVSGDYFPRAGAENKWVQQGGKHVLERLTSGQWAIGNGKTCLALTKQTSPAPDGPVTWQVLISNIYKNSATTVQRPTIDNGFFYESYAMHTDLMDPEDIERSEREACQASSSTARARVSANPPVPSSVPARAAVLPAPIIALTTGPASNPTAAPMASTTASTSAPTTFRTTSPTTVPTTDPTSSCIPPMSVPVHIPAAVTSADISEQDRGALHAFIEHSTALLHANADLQQVMRSVAAHDRALQVLVNKEKECPSLFWFYPKKPELRRWLSNPAKCLFQDTLMIVMVCPVTLCVVECGPEGVGWEVTKPKKWVKKWGPAILFSIYVMQAAVVAGRVVGIPLPPVPGATEVKEALGLKGMLGGLFSRGAEETNLGDSLAAFQEVTIAELDQTVESEALCEGLRSSGGGDLSAPLPADLPMHMVDEAYRSIHTFLTTGENAALGKLEDQLRGRMVREMAPDGDIEWVSVQGRDAWLQKHASVPVETGFAVSSALQNPATTSTLPSSISDSSIPRALTWLGEKLAAAGIAPELVQLCDRVLVQEQGFGSVKRLARAPTTKFNEAYLIEVGITAVGLQLELLDLHMELRATLADATPPLPASRSDEKATAGFTEEDRQLLRQLKLQQKAPEARTAVDRGNQMQYTASAFSQQGAQDQQQLARRIAELEARQARMEGVVTEHITDTALQFEDTASRTDGLLETVSTLSESSSKMCQIVNNIAAGQAITDAVLNEYTVGSELQLEDLHCRVDRIQSNENGQVKPEAGKSGKCVVC